MNYFIQQLINGLTLGSIYGLIAIGYTMVYGIIGMVNFAHGDVFMVGAFVSLITVIIFGVTGTTNIALGIGALILVAATIFLQNFVQATQGARVKPMSAIISGGFTILEGNDFVVRITYMQILIIVLTFLLMSGFTYLISKTSLGRAQRACEQDMKMAMLLGIDVNTTISTTFVIGAALAAVAGLMYLLYYGVIDFYIGFSAGIKAFTAAVLGGVGSLPGAMLGGLVIGLIEVFFAAYFSSEYKDVAAFSMLIIVLIFMPQGLLGRPEIEKV
ncbi:MAG: branched-chain amino acid ABC transporter permease LivH [Alphaproteobacteria bacterium]|nr:branched-chain amino acid ABC transporter permease LivH [Alphaproteobacteria bacterium]